MIMRSGNSTAAFTIVFGMMCGLTLLFLETVVALTCSPETGPGIMRGWVTMTRPRNLYQLEVESRVPQPCFDIFSIL